MSAGARNACTSPCRQICRLAGVGASTSFSFDRSHWHAVRIPGALANAGVRALAGWLLGGAVIAATVGGGVAVLITLLGVGMGRHGGVVGGYYGGSSSISL